MALIDNYKMVSAPLFSCLAAQTIKALRLGVKKRSWSWQWLFVDGGMPSAHTAMVIALAVAVGISQGFQSDEFAFALVFALIVLHDAMGVRRLAGQHSNILKSLLEKTQDTEAHNELPDHPVGHTPKEVLAGAFIGLLVTVLLFGQGSLVWEAAKRLAQIPLRHYFGSS